MSIEGATIFAARRRRPGSPPSSALAIVVLLPRSVQRLNGVGEAGFLAAGLV
jgi:hypothetical protein